MFDAVATFLIVAAASVWLILRVRRTWTPAETESTCGSCGDCGPSEGVFEV